MAKDGNTIGKAYIQILPSTENFGSTLKSDIGADVEKEGNEQGGKFADGFKKAAVAIGATIATVSAAAVKLGKEVINAYGEYEQLAGGAKLMWGDSYDFIAEKAASAWENVQMSTNDYLQAANYYATGLKTALGGNSQAAAELADNIITAQADIVAATGNSAEAVQNAFNGVMRGNYTMLDNLGLGIAGTKEGMQQVIDSVNDWRAAQGMAADLTIDSMADCEQALVDYVEMQGMAGYATEEGAATIQGVLASMSGAWDNLIAGLGDPEADVKSLAENVIQAFNNVVTNIAPIVGNIMQALPVAIEGIFSALSAMLPTLLTTVAGMFSSTLQALLAMLPELIPVMVDALMTCVNAIIENLPLIISAAIQIIVAIVQGIAEALPELIPAIIDAVMLMIQTLLDNLPLIISAAMEIIVALITGLVEALPQMIAYLPTIIHSIVDTLIENIDLIIQAGVTLLTSLISNLPQIIVEIVKAAPMIIAELVRGIALGIVEMGKAGLNLLKGLWDGIAGGISWLWNKISGWLSGLWNDILGFFGIHSPSKEMAWVGDMLVEGLAGGIKDNSDIATKAIDYMGEEVMDATASMMDEINATTMDVATNVPEGLAIRSSINQTLNAAAAGIEINKNEDNTIRILGVLEQFFPELLEAIKEGKIVTLDPTKLAQSMNSQFEQMQIRTARGV